MRVLEANIIVKDCAEACAFYVDIFRAKIGYLSDREKGYNEARIEIEGFHIHMFEGNAKARIFPPDNLSRRYMWWQFICDDANSLYTLALERGSEIIEEMRDLPNFGVRQGSITDPYGYSWILTQNIRALPTIEIPPPIPAIEEREEPPAIISRPKREIVSGPKIDMDEMEENE